jgi:hypothetical protein
MEAGYSTSIHPYATGIRTLTVRFWSGLGRTTSRLHLLPAHPMLAQSSSFQLHQGSDWDVEIWMRPGYPIVP